MPSVAHQITLLSLLILSTGCSYCPPTQRYDTSQFPPRCLDCPRIVANQMQLTRIPAQTAIRRTASKFSPGLPQNETCGCWRPASPTVVDIVLNSSSWVVSGLVMGSSRGQWLREINVQASMDNVTFIDWGNYTALNFTDATIAVFTLPIQARIFRLSVLRYANHYVNSTAGFAVAPIQALVSHTQPFTCACPLLSDGTCCPHLNMTVRNDECVWCMDPTKISTVMVDGCGKCRSGTFEFDGQCYYALPSNAINNLRMTEEASSNGVFWTAGLDITTDSRTVLLLYLTSLNFTHPCLANQTTACILNAMSGGPLQVVNILQPAVPLRPMTAARIAQRYLQFDRGRYSLNMTEQALRSWASCSGVWCNGTLGALFVTLFQNEVRIAGVQQPLRFQTGLPNLVCTGGGTQFLELARMELHLFPSDVWMVRIIGVQLRGAVIHVQWDEGTFAAYGPPSEFVTIGPPPLGWNQSLRVFDAYNSTRLELLQPVSIVVHGATDALQYSGILVEMSYGFGFDKSPQPGDSEQLVLITARSPQPVRLKSLSVSYPPGSAPVLYTTPQGFIINSNRVIDLTLSCSTLTAAALYQWIANAIQILLIANQIPPQIVQFVQRSCGAVASRAVSRAYWMVPERPPSSRTASVRMEITANFV